MQKFGQTLLVPVSILPAAGLLLGFGTSFQSANMIRLLPFLDNPGIKQIMNLMQATGSAIFTNLSLIFAIGVAVGMAKKNDGTAGLAAVAGFLIMNKTISVLMGLDAEIVAANTAMYEIVLGTPTLRTGVFGGIMMGLLAAWGYNRFHTIKLPNYLGFFQAKRFVPIVVSVLSIALGAIISLVWPPIQNGILGFSEFMLNQNTGLSIFLYAIIVKGLTPFGLHTAFYTPFYFQFGTYVDAAGQMITGDKQIFFAQLADQVPITGGMFTSGGFVMEMIAVAGPALAMYHLAKPEKKKATAGILFSAALTSMLTGVTEPFIYSYLFLAPVAYGAYTLCCGFAYFFTYLIGVRAGTTFACGLIDFLLINVLNNTPKWYLVIPLGIAFAAIEYALFRFIIVKFDYKTPGREADEDGEAEVYSRPEIGNSENARGLIRCFGGSQNIKSITCCATRLRAVVYNEDKIVEQGFKKYGAKGVFNMGKNYQVIIGLNVAHILSEIEEILSSPEELPVEGEGKQAVEQVKIVSPVSGILKNISEVEDPTFSEGMMGGGFAVVPEQNQVCAPISGIISSIFPTNHCVGITGENGMDVLVHIGVDTVHLNGEGFKGHVSEGQTVKRGERLVSFDREEVAQKAKSVDIIVVILNSRPDEYKVKAGSHVASGDNIIFS